jgi:hypothetical protein
MALSVPTLTLPAFPRRSANAVARSQAERLWLLAGGLGAGLLILIAYVFFIGPQRSDTSNVDSQIAAQNAANASLTAKINQLTAENRDLPKYVAELAQAQLALPSTAGISDFLRSLQALGNATQTNVTSLTVSQPVLFTAPAAPGATPSTGSTATAAAGSSASGASTVTAPVGPRIYTLAINATVSGSTDALHRFLDQLQTVQPRAVLITSLSETSVVAGTAGSTGSTGLQMTMDAFVAPTSTLIPSTVAPSAAATH